jgi:DNA-binding transcriptional ArsR family regulator
MDEKHITVSLGDAKVKEIGEIIGNKTCNKILDFLAGEDGTVTDISRKLKIPLNTVDYNVKKLVKAGLIEKASHWWSVKGKKMPMYRVSNRKIVISPRKSVAKVFAWVVGLTGLTALTLREFMGGSFGGMSIDKAADSSELLLEATSSAAANGSVGFWAGLGPWSWFLIGAWFAVVLFFVITLINDRRHRL